MTTSISNGPAIETFRLTKRFGRTVAVNGLSLTIPRGSTYGLLGPNGAGKSTTIKMLMGVLSPTAGEARVLGIDVRQDAVQVKQRVGYVPEVASHLPLDARQGGDWLLQVVLRARGTTKRAGRLLELFALDPDQKVKHLSKGMLTKLALLLAVSHEPELLLLDEPLSGLDPIVREEFLDGVLRTICRSRANGADIQPHARRRAAIGRHRGNPSRGAIGGEGNLDELLTTTKRICATLRDGCRPERPPEGTIWQRIQGREWIATVRDFSPEKVEQVQAIDGVEHVEVLDLGLEELFKDFVRGQRDAK